MAVKKVRKVFDHFLVLRRTLREIRLMRHFRHPNIMRLHEVLPLQHSHPSDLYISLELMDCDLEGLLRSKKVSIDDKKAKIFSAQILLGLLHLHSGHVLHRDLKPANIFVKLTECQVKIGDLGLSRGVAVDDDTGEAIHPIDEQLTEYVVTRWYRAPEVLLNRAKYGPPVDVWSVGCILYEMWAGKPLFPGKNSFDQLRRVACLQGMPSEEECRWVPEASMPLLQRCCKVDSPSEVSGLAKLPAVAGRGEGAELLEQMCAFDPSRRVSVEKALQHPYLRGFATAGDIERAKTCSPADVQYDKKFDGVSKAGEASALQQLGRLLRFEAQSDRNQATPHASPRTTPVSTPRLSRRSSTPPPPSSLPSAPPEGYYGRLSQRSLASLAVPSLPDPPSLDWNEAGSQAPMRAPGYGAAIPAPSRRRWTQVTVKRANEVTPRASPDQDRPLSARGGRDEASPRSLSRAQAPSVLLGKEREGSRVRRSSGRPQEADKVLPPPPTSTPPPERTEKSMEERRSIVAALLGVNVASLSSKARSGSISARSRPGEEMAPFSEAGRKPRDRSPSARAEVQDRSSTPPRQRSSTPPRGPFRTVGLEAEARRDNLFDRLQREKKRETGRSTADELDYAAPARFESTLRQTTPRKR